MGGKYTGVKAVSASSIEITFQYQGERCRERIKLKPTASNLKKASRHREAILGAIETGSFDYAVTFPDSKRAGKYSTDNSSNVTVESYLSVWIEEKKPTVMSSTYDDYEKMIRNQIIPALGSIQLTKLRRSDVREWVSGMTCGRKRIANILSPLRTALDDAVEDDYIQANPISGWRYRKKEEPKEQHVDPFSREEQAAIKDSATGQGRCFIQFAFWTGLRTSEIIALERTDIDLKKGEIHVTKAKTRAAEKPEPPKTSAGRRIVKLLPPAKAAIVAQLNERPSLHGPIFFNPNTGSYLTAKDIWKWYWKPAIKKAGIRYRNPYQTRHTYASMMLSAGEPLAWVSQQMGHADTHMTTKSYARWIPDALPEAGNKAVEMFS